MTFGKWWTAAGIGLLAAGCGDPVTPNEDTGPIGDPDAAIVETDAAVPPGTDAAVTPGTDAAVTPGTDAAVTMAAIGVTGLGAEEIAEGGRYEQVTLDGIPPWSDGIADLTIRNRSSAPLVVHSITLTPIAPTETYEWFLNTPGRTMLIPLAVSEETIPADGSFSFGLYFRPVASGPRDLAVDISYGAGEHFRFTVAGRGRDNLTLSPNVGAALERVFGRDNLTASSSFEPGAFVADGGGNLFFDGNVRQWNDRFNTNVVMARLSSDGTMSWVRELQEPFQQESRDIGNNAEIGGGQDSLDVDATQAYLAAERTLSSTAAFGCLVLAADSTTGELAWARNLNNHATNEETSTAAQVLRCQTVDASLGDRVIVSGQVADSTGGFIAALSKTDGALLWARHFGTGATRVGALVVDATNRRAYVGGIMGGAPFTARFDGVDGTSPTASWIRPMGPSLSNVHGLALDPSGAGLLAAFDVRGATTQFTVARVATADGAIAWSRTWDEGSAVNRALSVTMHGGQAVFTGRIGIQPFDPQGDGFLLALDPATGAYGWSALYYGGRGAEEIMNTSATGVVSAGGSLWLLSYQTPGALNPHHFWGRWYTGNDGGTPGDPFPFPDGDGSARLTDAGITAGAPAATALTTPANFRAHVATVTAAEWADVTPMQTYEDPRVAEDAMFQAGTQGLIQQLTITP